MEPTTTAALIGAGGSLFGGALGRSGGGAATYQANKLRWAANTQFKAQMRWAKDFAKMGVRWRVEDAKKAGLHPVFGLGGNLSPGSAVPTVSPGGYSPGQDPMAGALADAGQNISRAVLAQATPEEKAAAHMARVAAAAGIEKDLAQADYWRSEAARNRQQGPVSSAIPSTIVARSGPAQAFPVSGDPQIPQTPLTYDTQEVTAVPTFSRRSDIPWMVAGRHAAMADYLTPWGSLVLPFSPEGAGEAMQNVPWWMWPSIIGESARHQWNEGLELSSKRGPARSGGYWMK